MKTAKKLLCLLMTVAMLVSVIAIAPTVNAAKGPNGLVVLEPGLADDGYTLDIGNWVGGTAFSAIPTASNGFPLVWVHAGDAFSNTDPEDYTQGTNKFEVPGFFTDTVMLRAPYSSGGPRYVDYNVVGGSYIGFLSYYRNNYSPSTLYKMWFQNANNTKGVRVMYSTDNGATWEGPLSHSALFEFTRTSTKNAAPGSQDVTSQLNTIASYVLNNKTATGAMSYFYDYIGMCHSYQIPEDATMVRYIFPEEDLLLTDVSWGVSYGFFYGGAAASATPISNKNYVFEGTTEIPSEPDPEPDPEPEPEPELPPEADKDIFYPGTADDLTGNAYGSTLYGKANYSDYNVGYFTSIWDFLTGMDIPNVVGNTRYSETAQFLGYNGATPEALDNAERSLTYNVVGDTYFGLDFYSGTAEVDSLIDMIYDRYDTGWQLWISSDNGETYEKINPYDYYLNKMGRIVVIDGAQKDIPVTNADCWFGQGGHLGLLDFLVKNKHLQQPGMSLGEAGVGASHFSVGKAYYLPEGTTNAKIVFPSFSFVGNGDAVWNVALTGVKSSLTPITADSTGTMATADGVTLPEYDNTIALDTFNKATGAAVAAAGSANVNYSYNDSAVYVNVETDADIVDFYYINNINFLQNITGNTVFDLFNIPANVDGDISSAIGKVSYNKTTGEFTTGNMGGVFSADDAKYAKATETGVSFIVPRSTVCDKFLFHVAAYNEGDSTMLSTGSINGGSLAGFKTLNFADVSSKYTFADGKVNNIKYGTTVNNFIMGNGESVALYNIDGKALASNEILRTGTYAVVNGNRYDIILENDVNGDADFNVLDLVTVRNYLLNVTDLAPASKKAAGADEITIVELLSLKDDILAGKTFETEEAYSPKYISLDGEYSIKNTASAQAIKDYLATALTVEGFISATTVGTLEPGVDPTFEADLNTVLTTGAKLIARAGFVWGAGLDMNIHFANCFKWADYVHRIDSRILLEACIFESIAQTTAERTMIPAYVFEAFDLPVETRAFDYWSIINYNYENKWGDTVSVPNLVETEAQMWFYYLATQYIDAGFDVINLGQVAMSFEEDDGTVLNELLTMIREYAAENGRNNNVLITGHNKYNISKFILKDGNLLFDFDTFPSRIYDGDGEYAIEANGYMPCTLKAGYLDSIYQRTSGGKHPQGYNVSENFYVVEIDNFENNHPGDPTPATHYPWGYDEITWFALQPKEGQTKFLNHMINSLKLTDPGTGYISLPGRRTATRTINGETEYHFNASSLVKNGQALESVYRDVYSKQISA